MRDFGWKGRLKPSSTLAFLLAGLVCLATAHLTQQRKILSTVECATNQGSALSRVSLSCSGQNNDVTAVSETIDSAKWLEIDVHGDAAAIPRFFLQAVGTAPETREPTTPAVSEIQPGRQWIEVPEYLQSKPLRLIVISSHDAAAPLNLRIRRAGRVEPDFIQLAKLLFWIAALHFFAVEVAWLLSRHFDYEIAATMSLLAVGAIGFVAFWVYYVSHSAGICLTWLCVTALIGHAAARGARNVASDGAPASRLLEVTAWLVVFIFVTGLFPYAQDWNSWHFAANRWRGLPIDNWLPKIFADQLWEMKLQKPMMGDWLSSDRPPLQTGIYLLAKTLAPNDPGFYQVLGMWLQATFLVPSIIILRRLLPRQAMWMATLTVALSATIMINTLFVWPKLLAATYTAIFYIVISRPASKIVWLSVVMAGIAAALAMLAHGGAIFSILGISLWALVSGQFHRARLLAASAVIAAVAYAPWVYYQHAIDPPGNRLIIWHVAGFVPIQPGNTLDIIKRGYSDMTPSSWFQGKLESLSTLTKGSTQFFDDAKNLMTYPSGRDLPGKGGTMIEFSFYYLSYALWWFSPLTALFGLALSRLRRRHLPNEIWPLLISTIGAMAVWTIILYKAGDTVIHQGAYLVPMAMLFISMTMTCNGSILLYRVGATLNIATCLVLLVAVKRGLAWETRESYYMLVIIALAGLVAAANRAVKPAIELGMRPQSFAVSGDTLT